MAETIAAHLPALAAAAAGALGSAPSGATDQLLYGLDDEEYPFAHGALNGVKCCTKCGATKTPQWREGPFGPKTLCNACGVKRTRKLRAEQEGAKRRKLGSASPAPLPHLKLASAASYPPPSKYATRPANHSPEVPHGLAALDRYGSLEPDSEAWVPAGGRRPARRAAEEAAFKTARYARTGEWSGAGQEGSGGAYEDGARGSTPSCSSDYSLPSSHCPEEVSWPPLQDGPAGGDCYAAINLMTMSAKQTAHALAAVAAAAAGGAPSGAGSPASVNLLGSTSVAGPLVLDPEQFNHDALASLAARSGSGSDGASGSAAAHAPPAHHKVAPVDLAELSQCLPPNKVLELVRLNQELELSVHEVHAANAAVAAVAQVLASKQAAALRSREVAGAATKRLRRFMAELDTQFGIQSKFGGSSRRPSLSPTKPASQAPLAPALSPCAPVPPPQLPVAPALDAAGSL